MEYYALGYKGPCIYYRNVIPNKNRYDIMSQLNFHGDYYITLAADMHIKNIYSISSLLIGNQRTLIQQREWIHSKSLLTTGIRLIF